MFSLLQLKNKKDIDANKSLKTCFVLMIFNFIANLENKKGLNICLMQ